MEVILLDDVESVGLRGDVVNVARGYARNFLLPRRLAELATPAKVAELQKREEHRSRHEARDFEHARELATSLEQVELRFDVQAGATGTLFGSVTATNVADELWRAHKIRVDRRKIDLPESIKRIGRYSIPVELFQDVTVEVKTLVVPEGGELPPEEELEAMEAAEAAAAESEEEHRFSDEELEALAAAEDEAEAAEEAEAVEPTAAERAEELPADDFDRAVDASTEEHAEPAA
jgi:large subunit ribosomal protein L9